jgi:hypothetical protein
MEERRGIFFGRSKGVLFWAFRGFLGFFVDGEIDECRA